MGLFRKRKEDTPKPPRVPLRQRVSLSAMLLMTSLAAILGAGSVAGYYALKVLYENKLVDTWAILFLELEQQGNRLAQRLENFGATLPSHGEEKRGPASRQPDVILQVGENGSMPKIRGDFPAEIKLADLHLEKPALKERWTVLQFNGQDYLAVQSQASKLSSFLGALLPNGQYFLLWKVDIGRWMNETAKDPSKDIVYVVTTEGRMLYSNEPTITQTNFSKRSLVQRFIASPFRHGQIDFDGPDGPSYGFFSEIPNTNLMLFTETTKRVALASVREVAVRFMLVLLIILGLSALILQYPLASLISPMRELVKLAGQIADGNFHITPRRQGFGELRELTRAFGDMGKRLVARDEKIQALLVEQKEKIRLVGELAIAQSIQDNFLLKAPLPPEAGVEVAAQYSPASEVAGDWYGYYYDEASGESVFAIADVSGHGAGSAMFTAIIAATFEEMRVRARDDFAMEDFARRLNRLILKLGRGKWHATLLVAKYRARTGEIEILNGGHPFPLMILPPADDGKRPSDLLIMRSDLLGVSLDFTPNTLKTAFPSGATLLMYTDGLIEGRPDRRTYSQKRLIKACQPSGPQSITQLVSQVYDDWNRHLGGQQPLDDLCLLAVRAA